jgi:hypothetical protein
MGVVAHSHKLLLRHWVMLHAVKQNQAAACAAVNLLVTLPRGAASYYGCHPGREEPKTCKGLSLAGYRVLGSAKHVHHMHACIVAGIDAV